ncbi:MAG: BamA/TamA family outer membrane protein, partial [Rhodothermales bacterium]|nr:BamA/TamA family outer membrane protein [Rhodothermales bacterium]
TLGIQLNRLPGQTSTVGVTAIDPFLFSFPLGIELGFDGEQRDSTYGKQRYEAAITYKVLDGIDLSASVLREATRPGQSGVAFTNGVQRISRADALLAGVGIAYRNTDDPVNPRRGVVFRSSFERGSKSTTQRRIAEQDTVSTKKNFRQERLDVSLRGYVPLAARHVAAVGVDAGLLRSDEYDASDLLRFGGASSLRGYNEEQFSGRFVNRFLVEYRYLLERRSFAYLFVDVGVVERPEIEDQPEKTTVYPGYGFGLQFETGVGVVNATYALNRDDGPTNGKIHVGLSFAL